MSSDKRKVAKQHARIIAELIESRVLSYNRNHSNEPTWYYRVPIHTSDFWFSILVSDSHFMLKGSHKRYRAFLEPFAFSFKNPWMNLGTTTFLPKVSGKLNTQTFSSKISDDTEFDSSEVLSAIAVSLGEIDFDKVDIFFLNSTEIYFLSGFTDAKSCVKTCTVLRTLVLSCFETLQVTEAP